MWGAGGGGAGSVVQPASNAEFFAGEGGGAGGYVEKEFDVVPGTTYFYVLGAAGAAGPAGLSGQDGGTSSWDGGKIYATGGQGGRVASASIGTPYTAAREGGMGYGGSINLRGGYGGVVVQLSPWTYPGAGGDAPLGGVGAVASSTAPSQPTAPGGGGGGAGGSGNIPGTAGGLSRIDILY